jgi:hypothetical protein
MINNRQMTLSKNFNTFEVDNPEDMISLTLGSKEASMSLHYEFSHSISGDSLLFKTPLFIMHRLVRCIIFLTLSKKF